jgi:3-oxoacyl-[acyl-carrier protein] reductase
MKARRWGRIINVTSIAVKQPVDGLILSNSVRAAVTGSPARWPTRWRRTA